MLKSNPACASANVSCPADDHVRSQALGTATALLVSAQVPLGAETSVNRSAPRLGQHNPVDVGRIVERNTEHATAVVQPADREHRGQVGGRGGGLRRATDDTV
jgi:hypothetical protein